MDDRSNRTTSPTIGDVVISRYRRRTVLKGMTIGAAVTALGGAASVLAGRPARAAEAGAGSSTLTFPELSHGMTDTHAVADGFDAVTLIRWGDPVEAGAPAFDPQAQTASAQAKQWGYNNDFVAFMPLPEGSEAADHGLLCVNFEYTNFWLMFPGLKEGEVDKVSREQAETEMAAIGHGIIEIKRDGEGGWRVAAGSPYARRITALQTPMVISGPAAGDARLWTSEDPTGTRVIGTLGNCAGGVTPWGTVLSAEENIQDYFAGDPTGTPEARNHARMGIRPTARHAWAGYHDRFNLAKEPNEPNRFGWIVEIDPYDPRSTPVKRTALGRFKHEGATAVVNPDGRVVVYTGDDERFEYVYKFVTDRRYDPENADANRDLLDDGTLFVARFDADGTLTWLPLVWGTGPLTPENGFASQADVLIEARHAAELLGATPMDRPEEVETNPVTGTTFVILTNNTKRADGGTNAPNPRGPNPAGHILELVPPGAPGKDADHAALIYKWAFFLLAGDPTVEGSGARYHEGISADGWFAAPDNMAFDREGRIWIATDGAQKFGVADGLWAADVTGPGRALTRHFYRTPTGAETCGPCFNADDTALFVAVQHPGDTDGATFDNPSTRWPAEAGSDMPPRPSIQVIAKKGRPIG